MEPTVARQSILLEPSNGSKHTTNLPDFSVSTSTTLSISSDTNKQLEYDFLRKLINIWKKKYFSLNNTMDILYGSRYKNSTFKTTRVLIFAVQVVLLSDKTTNLFVTSKNETTYSPIHESNVLQKGQSAFKIRS